MTTKQIERQQKILSFVKEQSYTPVKIKEMAVLFCVPKKERGDFHNIIDTLVSAGEIEIDRGGRIRLPKDSMVEGEFMPTRRGFAFVRVEGREDDIFIPESHCGNAYSGDIVRVRITHHGDGKGRSAEGEILQVIERHTASLVGTFAKKKHISYVIPDSAKWTKDVSIPKDMTMGAVDGHKVIVDITDYGDGVKGPMGKVTQILGHRDDPGVDILSVVKDYGLSDEYPKEVLCELGDIPDCVSEDEMTHRLDLRHLDTVTIDGEDAKDLDDAITIQMSEDGTYELGVHIADVSHYVREGSPLDREALRRGTSVYLVDRVIPMLPRRLSNHICSLNAGEDRLALSCIMTIDAKGEVISHRIAETVIRVTERMSYHDVAAILVDRDQALCERYEALIPMFHTMADLEVILHRRRKKNGSIDFDFPECKIKLDASERPMDIVPYERNVATDMIEEFMLAANETVAEEYYWLEIPFLYRTHERPDPEKIQKLSRMTALFGHSMKVGKGEVHPREIQKMISNIQGTKEEAFLSRLTLRSMKRAKYTTLNEGHFGLATSYYCHFTSPIRRYPDLQIHRIIKENIHSGMGGERLAHYESILPGVAKQCSDAERLADDAERDVEKLKKTEYMENHLGDVYTGVISGVTSWGIYVELENTVEGMVRLADMSDDHYDYEEEHYRVIGHRTRKEYRLGQSVSVQVARVDRTYKTIDFVLIEGEDTSWEKTQRN